MGTRLRALTTLNRPPPLKNEELSKNFKSLLIWNNENKPVAKSDTTFRTRKSDANTKTDDRRVIVDWTENKLDRERSQDMLEDEKVKPLFNPNDLYDDFNLFWNPLELIEATRALSTYNVEGLYKKNPYTVKNIMHLIFLVIKYKPLLKDLLEIGEYFQRFPEDAKDEKIVCIALFDILCRGNTITLENEMSPTLRKEYKDTGLKVVYMQIEKDRVHYFEQVHERLNDIGASSVHDLLPSSIHMQLNFAFPIIFDVWINNSELDVWPEELLAEAGFIKAGTHTTGGLTYNEIVDMPYFYELGVSNYTQFVKMPHYCNHVFIPTDRKYCLAMTQVVKQLIKGGIRRGSVIQTHIQSLSATAYFAYLLNIAFPSKVTLSVFGADQMKESFESYFRLLKLKNVKVFSERFYIVNCRKKDIASTTCVLVNPESLFNPSLNITDEAVNRGCDVVWLESAYELYSENDTYDYNFLNQYTQDLKEMAKCNIQRALSIPKVKFVVYTSFDTKESADNNLAKYVVDFKRECSSTSIKSVNEAMSTTEAEDANYKYCRKLNLYFRMGNNQNNYVSPEVWGSKPPFITTMYRVDPVIYDSFTEDELNKEFYKRSTSSNRSPSIKSPWQTQSKASYVASFMTSGDREVRKKNAVFTSARSTDKKLGFVSSKVNIKFLKPGKKGHESDNSEPSNKSNLRKVSKGVSSQGSSVKKVQSSGISSLERTSVTVLPAEENPPDFKKMILSQVLLKNQLNASIAEDEPVLKKILKKRKAKKSVNERKEVLFSDEMENIDSQKKSASEKSSLTTDKKYKSSASEKSSQITDKKDISEKKETSDISIERLSENDSVVIEHKSFEDYVQSLHPPKTSESKLSTHNKNKQHSLSKGTNKRKETSKNNNTRLSNSEPLSVKNVPARVKMESNKTLKKDLSNSKYLSQKFKNKENKQTVFIAQQKSPNIKETLKTKPGEKTIPKKSYEIKRSIILSDDKLKVEKVAPIISFGTIFYPKSTRAQKGGTEVSNISNNYRNKPLLKKVYTPKKKAYVEDVSSSKSKQRSVKKVPIIKNKDVIENKPSTLTQKSSVKENWKNEGEEILGMATRLHTRKQLNEMHQKYKMEIMQSFQKHFFDRTKASDVCEKSSNKINRPSSSVSWKTYVKTARKLSKLNLITLLQKQSSKKEAKKKKTKESYFYKSKSSIKTSTTESDLSDSVDISDTQLSPGSTAVYWHEYQPENLLKHLKVHKDELKTNISSVPSTKSHKNKRTSSKKYNQCENKGTLWTRYESSDSDEFFEKDQTVLKPSISTSKSGGSLKKIYKRKTIPRRRKPILKATIPKQKIKKNKKGTTKQKNKSSISADESDGEFKELSKSRKSSITEIILENSEATQTKRIRQKRVYDVGTQADHVDIYLSFTEEVHDENLQFYKNLVRNANITSGHSLAPKPLNIEEFRRATVEEEKDCDTKQCVAKDSKGRSDLRHSIISTKVLDENVTVSKMITWFQKLESKAPVPPRVVSYTLKRLKKSTRRPTKLSLVTPLDEVEEETSDDLIEEGVDDFPPLIQDYKIDDAQTILAQMRLYESGERDLKKLISTDLTEFVDFKALKKKALAADKEKTPPVEEENEEIVTMNKNLLKFKADEISMESITDDDGYVEEESFNMETKGKDMNSLLTRLVDNIFEADTRPRKPSGNEEEEVEVPVETAAPPPVKQESTYHSQDSEYEYEEPYPSPSLAEIWRNTTREAWSKKNNQMKEEPEQPESPEEDDKKQMEEIKKVEEEKTKVVKIEKKEEEDNYNEDTEEFFRLSELDPDRYGTSMIDAVFCKTPTDGLSNLAKELYEIRDVIEFYLHSKVVPLDWRVMIDRHSEE